MLSCFMCPLSVFVNVPSLLNLALVFNADLLSYNLSNTHSPCSAPRLQFSAFYLVCNHLGRLGSLFSPIYNRRLFLISSLFTTRSCSMQLLTLKTQAHPLKVILWGHTQSHGIKTGSSPHNVYVNCQMPFLTWSYL